LGGLISGFLLREILGFAGEKKRKEKENQSSNNARKWGRKTRVERYLL
jgi:hypothetical protein